MWGRGVAEPEPVIEVVVPARPKRTVAERRNDRIEAEQLAMQAREKLLAQSREQARLAWEGPGRRTWPSMGSRLMGSTGRGSPI